MEKKWQKPVILAPDQVQITSEQDGLNGSAQGESQETRQQDFVSIPDKVDTVKKKFKGWLWAGLAFVFGATVYDTYNFLSALHEQSPVIAAGFSLLLLGFIAGLSRWLAKEWRMAKKLDAIQDNKATERRLSREDSFGGAVEFVQDIGLELQQSTDVSLLNFREHLDETHNDYEVIRLFSETVLTTLDKKASAIISRHAGEAAVMVAISPMALMDIMLLLWRNIRMIREIEQLYGCPTGILTKGKMLKYIGQNLLYAGSSELIADAGADLLGGKVAAHVSTQFAQGIGAGVFSIRLGVQAVKVCRPLEQPSQISISVKDIRAHVVEHVKSQVMVFFRKSASSDMSQRNDGEIQ